MIYTLFLIIAWLLVALFLLAENRGKYKRAFRDTATKLYNVTSDRDALFIQNTGLKSELVRTCVENERLNETINAMTEGRTVECP